MINELILTYSGFNVSVSNVRGSVEKFWRVEDYGKVNYFASYYYNGSIVEYKLGTNEIVSQHHDEHFYNEDLTLPFHTREVYTNVSWLCFSSYSRKIASEFLILDGRFVLPSNTGAFNVLGTFDFDEETPKTSRVLNYLKPRPYEIEIEGQAKIILLSGIN